MGKKKKNKKGKTVSQFELICADLYLSKKIKPATVAGLKMLIAVEGGFEELLKKMALIANTCFK
jgi:hypothetical protein